MAGSASVDSERRRRERILQIGLTVADDAPKTSKNIGEQEMNNEERTMNNEQVRRNPPSLFIVPSSLFISSDHSEA
jgi:hypothetical protein